jgi:APA family basic amino acid/polyamine antiporter
LSPVLTKKHARFGTPWVAIGVSCAIYAALALMNLAQLIKVYAWLRIAVTILTVLAAWKLRQKKPELARPFRIPWGGTGLAYVVVAPLAMSVVALFGSDRFSLVWGPAALALGPLGYFAFGRRSSAGRANQEQI